MLWSHWSCVSSGESHTRAVNATAWSVEPTVTARAHPQRAPAVQRDEMRDGSGRLTSCRLSAILRATSMERARPPIDIISLSETLNTRVVACHDETAGRGYRALLGQGAGHQPTEITVFPDTGVVHIATELADLTLRRAELKASVIENEPVIEIWGTTETSWAGTMVYRNGGVVFTTTRQRSEPGPPVFTAPESCSALPAASEAGGQPRIALSGRIGAQPHFRTTSQGTDILGFPLAVHDQPGKIPVACHPGLRRARPGAGRVSAQGPTGGGRRVHAPEGAHAPDWRNGNQRGSVCRSGTRGRRTTLMSRGLCCCLSSPAHDRWLCSPEEV